MQEGDPTDFDLDPSFASSHVVDIECASNYFICACSELVGLRQQDLRVSFTLL